MRKIILTEKQYKKLEDVLFYAQDEGPSPEGWASDELEEIRAIVKAAQQGEQGDEASVCGCKKSSYKYYVRCGVCGGEVTK